MSWRGRAGACPLILPNPPKAPSFTAHPISTWALWGDHTWSSHLTPVTNTVLPNFPPSTDLFAREGWNDRKIHTSHHLDPFWYLVFKSSIFLCHSPAHHTLTWTLGLPHECQEPPLWYCISCKSAPAEADGLTQSHHTNHILAWRSLENLTHLFWCWFFFFSLCYYTQKRVPIISLSENAIIFSTAFTSNEILQKLNPLLEYKHF